MNPRFVAPGAQPFVRGGPEQNRPRDQRKQRNGTEKPEWLRMMKHRGEVALEVVLPDKNAQEVRIAHGAEHVPRQRDSAECRDGQRMQGEKSCMPLFCRESP